MTKFHQVLKLVLIGTGPTKIAGLLAIHPLLLLGPLNLRTGSSSTTSTLHPHSQTVVELCWTWTKFESVLNPCG